MIEKRQKGQIKGEKPGKKGKTSPKKRPLAKKAPAKKAPAKNLAASKEKTPTKKKALPKKKVPSKKAPAKSKAAVKKKAKKKAPKKPDVKRERISNEKIAEALHASSGYLAVAAEKLGLARSTIYRWINEDEELKKEVESIQESLLDFAESKLMGQIKNGNMTAICFFLKCKGKERGYIERQELTGPNGAPLQESAADVFRAMREQLRSHPERVIELESKLLD